MHAPAGRRAEGGLLTARVVEMRLELHVVAAEKIGEHELSAECRDLVLDARNRGGRVRKAPSAKVEGRAARPSTCRST